MLRKNRIAAAGLWLIFMIAAAAHVAAIIKFRGTQAELSIVATLAILIFACGAVCGWNIAVARSEDLMYEEPVPPKHTGRPVRQRQVRAYEDERPLRREPARPVRQQKRRSRLERRDGYLH